MASFDASMISKIGDSAPDPAASVGKAFTLANMVDENKMNKLSLAQAEKAQSDQADIENIIKKGDYTKPGGYLKTAADLTAAGYPQKSQELMKLYSDYTTGQYQAQLQKLDVASRQQDIVAGGFDNVLEQINVLKDAADQSGKPLSPKALDALVMQYAPDEANRIKAANPELSGMVDGFMKDPKNMTYAGIVHLEAESNRGQQLLKQHREAVELGLKQRNEQREEAANKETAAHNRAMEPPGARATGGGNGSSSGDKVNAVYAAMADGGISFPPGMRSVRAQRQMIDGLIKAHPNDTPQQIADRVKSGELGFAGSKTALNVVERREGSAAAAINALNRKDGLYDQVLEVGKNVDFSPSKLSNAWALYKQGKLIADPNLSEYINVLSDTRAEFASVLARGGQVTDSVRIAAEHAFPDTMSYGELQRNVERSKKVAEAIQNGNTEVADAIIGSKSLTAALHSAEGGESKKPPAASGNAPPAGFVLDK